MSPRTNRHLYARGRNRGALAIPLAIIIAGIFIAGAIYVNGRAKAQLGAQVELTAAQQGGTPEFRPVTADDHILGNPDAPITIIEYSDTECPYCKTFHLTMLRIIDEYGKAGYVNWVYRHFPLEAIHKKARVEAEATECAAEMGGNAGFWAYLTKLFEVTPSNDGLDHKLLPQIAENVGLNKELFERCLKSGRHAAKVQDDFDDARRAGANGTPYSIIIVGGNVLPLNGAQPYSAVKGAIDAILSEQGAPPSEVAP